MRLQARLLMTVKPANGWHPFTPVMTVADDGAWELTNLLDQGMVCHEYTTFCLLLL